MLAKKSMSIILLSLIIMTAVLFSLEENLQAEGIYYLGERELEPGLEGSDIALLQRELADRGLYHGAIDGLYGPQTEEAVKEFQLEKGLNADGRAGSETLGYFSGDELFSKLNISRSDLLALGRVIHGEARGESFRGMVAVGSVIVNRVEDSRFPSTIQEVIREDGQFSSLMDGQANLYPDDRSLDAARAALMGYDPSRQSLFFYNPEIATNLAWISQRPVVQRIGNHVFAR